MCVSKWQTDTRNGTKSRRCWTCSIAFIIYGLTKFRLNYLLKSTSGYFIEFFSTNNLLKPGTTKNKIKWINMYTILKCILQDCSVNGVANFEWSSLPLKKPKLESNDGLIFNQCVHLCVTHSPWLGYSAKNAKYTFYTCKSGSEAHFLGKRTWLILIVVLEIKLKHELLQIQL